MPEAEEYAFYIGVDWATEAHQVVVLDSQRRPVMDRVVAHTGAALIEWADSIVALAGGDPARVAAAIEVPHGPVVETLLERGVHVYALNPKQLDRFRDRYTVAGAKDDRRDAHVAAASLATDRPAFRRLHPEDPKLIRLRELARGEAELQQELARLANRLRDQLLRYDPQALTLCPAADEPWLWALLELAPTPAAAQRLTRARVTQLLRAHRVRRLTAEAVLAELRTPAVPVAPGTSEAVSEQIAWGLPRLALLHAQHRECGRRVQALLTALSAPPPGQPGEHRDAAILRSLPGVGRMVAASVLAEAGRLLTPARHQALRAHTGIAPVTDRSGKRVAVRMRYACSARLRYAMYHWGRTSIQHDAHCRQHYAELRQRGHSHGRALRGVVDRLLRILMAMLKTRTLYDPSRCRPLEKTA